MCNFSTWRVLFSAVTQLETGNTTQRPTQKPTRRCKHSSPQQPPSKQNPTPMWHHNNIRLISPTTHRSPNTSITQISKLNKLVICNHNGVTTPSAKLWSATTSCNQKQMFFINGCPAPGAQLILEVRDVIDPIILPQIEKSSGLQFLKYPGHAPPIEHNYTT